MVQERKTEIVRALEQYMSDYKISQNEVAKRTGVNVAYIVSMRKGEFTIDVKGKPVEIAEKYFTKIAEFVGYKYGKDYWQTKPTEQLLEILTILEESRNLGNTSTIIGDTGCGKTYGIDIFRQKYPNETFVVTISQLDRIADILDKIIETMHLPEARGNAKKMRMILAKLRDMRLNGYKPTLVFDEGEYMKLPALCAVKELYDGLHGICAIILVGHYQLLSNIEKLKKKSKDGIPQLYRRIKFGIRTLAPIDRRYSLFLDNIEDKSLIKFLQNECDNYGELHDVVVATLREAEVSGEPVNESLVKKIFNIR